MRQRNLKRRHNINFGDVNIQFPDTLVSSLSTLPPPGLQALIGKYSFGSDALPSNTLPYIDNMNKIISVADYHTFWGCQYPLSGQHWLVKSERWSICARTLVLANVFKRMIFSLKKTPDIPGLQSIWSMPNRRLSGTLAF